MSFEFWHTFTIPQPFSQLQRPFPYLGFRTRAPDEGSTLQRFPRTRRRNFPRSKLCSTLASLFKLNEWVHTPTFQFFSRFRGGGNTSTLQAKVSFHKHNYNIVLIGFWYKNNVMFKGLLYHQVVLTKWKHTFWETIMSIVIKLFIHFTYTSWQMKYFQKK